MRASTVVLVCSLTGLIAGPLAGQGTLSTQGLGFPPGQLSTRAVTIGGSIGEADAISALNPAALGLLGTAMLAFQAEPEYRELQLSTATSTLRSSASRFPLFMGAMPLGSRWTVGLSVSTLLDRTYQTAVRDTQTVGGEDVAATITERSVGSIADIRLAVSFAPSPWLRIGLGGHALSGSDILQTVRAFDDTVRFATDRQRTVVGFGGNALSAGAVMVLPRRGALGVSYRRGGSINAYDGNTVVGSGHAPDHLGISAVYLGIRGTSLAVRAARDDWTRLEGMSPSLNIHEGWDLGIGADVTGPRLLASALGLRAGLRWRTLPFSSTASPVREQTWSGGFMIPVGRLLGSTRAVEVSLGALRASRTTDPLPTPSGDVAVSEKSWTISTGFSVRP